MSQFKIKQTVYLLNDPYFNSGIIQSSDGTYYMVLKSDDSLVKVSKEEAAEFYKVHQTKGFYNDLCNYLSSGPIIVMILAGENAVSKNRQLMGSTDPRKAEEGTLRKMYGISIDKNSVHGSDSVENGKKEIEFFF